MINIFSVLIMKLIKNFNKIVFGVYGKIIGMFNVGLELGINLVVIFWKVGIILVKIIWIFCKIIMKLVVNVFVCINV